MKVLAVSDNHGERYILTELINLYQHEVNTFVHCGDSELSPTDNVWDTMNTVKGNMDFTDGYPVTRVEETDEKPLFVTHGHLHQVKTSFNQIVKEAKEADAHFAFYGHTHKPAVDYQNGVWLINPGSISQPRGKNKHKTYAIVETKDNQLAVHYFDENHNEVKKLSTVHTLN